MNKSLQVLVMNGKYVFRKIIQEEIPSMFSLVLKRIVWMDENNIRQWNVTNYAEAYPENYYYEQYENGNVFVLEEEKTGEIVCAAILQETDKRWNDNVPSIYLHNFVSKVGAKSAGTIFLELCRKICCYAGKAIL